jgi:uncharacterized protein YqgC (DUF456 family)
MQNKIKRLLILSLGIVLIILGLAGLFLPVLQGVLLLVAGLYLVSYEVPVAGKLLAKIRTRYPKLAKKIEQAKLKAKNVTSRVFRKKMKEGTGDEI